jgi:hypothetical protein
MSDRQDLSSDPRAECTSNIKKNDPHRGSLQLTRLKIPCVHNGVYTDANFACVYEVSDSGVRDVLRLDEACQHGGKHDGENKPFHVRPPTLLVAPASENGARAGARCTNGVVLRTTGA